MLIQSESDLERIKEDFELRHHVRINLLLCGGTGCRATKSAAVRDSFEEELKKRGITDTAITLTGCKGFCANGPTLVVDPGGYFYQKVKAEDAPLIVEEHILNNRPIEKLMYLDPATKARVPLMRDIPFFKKQEIRVLRNLGRIDPFSINHYIARDGYQAAVKAILHMTPEQIVSEVRLSGIRGRGGAGFLTGLKWELCAKSPGSLKYIICNGDEGDPGAFMDRGVMESDPHAVIEGMIIAARAIGSRKGYIYVRAEYPLAIETLEAALRQARAYGLLGANLFGTDFSIDIEIYKGAGAFVCGEETALISSIEGDRGNPVPKPPFPVHKGLWERPTVINNVETLANIPQIILRGADWFKSVGTERSTGTKVFALTGDIQNIGLIEIPMGIPLKQIIEDIGGGVPKGRKLKAVQLGGPSGGCIPHDMLDTPVTYEDIVKTGAIVGSGGMVVMSDRSCMVDVAKFFIGFTKDESCGKCVACREGTKVMLTILEDITEGRATLDDLNTLEDLANDVRKSSLCGLGQTAPNPVLSTIRYFRHEYEEHILNKRCSTGACRELTTFHIDPEKCTGCTACALKCAVTAISGEKKKPHHIDQSRCITCRMCYETCKFGAIHIGPGAHFAGKEVPA
ncbi:MAG TPA: NADH-quinone oxidoreductase subunit NuoF [Thermodesulfovibrionales bacterium]|nr:NADH-quinone oxidoreductase subunit NuoF [Thermodesulfovibrionales bacterium]